jgi:Domain of unknown function (DUF4145)
MGSIQIINYEGASKSEHIGSFPDECPFCHRHISPRVWGGAYGEMPVSRIQAVFLCTNDECRKLFLAYYTLDGIHSSWSLRGVMKGTHDTTEFSDDIEGVSPNFVKIFSQAEIAEQEELSEICGVGYRKALEFLVKDYVIKKNPNDEEKIKKQLLGNTIKEYATDDRIKTVAERAAWLGNDETHYVRKWEDKDVRDLKGLIHLTVLWIQMEIETERIKKDMPEPKK